MLTLPVALCAPWLLEMPSSFIGTSSTGLAPKLEALGSPLNSGLTLRVFRDLRFVFFWLDIVFEEGFRNLICLLLAWKENFVCVIHMEDVWVEGCRFRPTYARKHFLHYISHD